MAGIGLSLMWVGDGAVHGGKATTLGTLYPGVVAASPSYGAASADVSVQIAGATVSIFSCPQAQIGPTAGGIPLATMPGAYYVVA